MDQKDMDREEAYIKKLDFKEGTIWKADVRFLGETTVRVVCSEFQLEETVRKALGIPDSVEVEINAQVDWEEVKDAGMAGDEEDSDEGE